LILPERSIIFTSNNNRSVILLKSYTYILIAISLLSGTGVCAQKQQDIIAGINQYVRFTNESIHGMLIAHRLFENYNQDVNKYVDLPGHQLNFYNNNDLPADIFEDPDHWFYEVSPKALYDICQKNEFGLPPETNSLLKNTVFEIWQTTQLANKLRLSVADSINMLKINDQEALLNIYEMLETAVDAYDLLQAQVIILNDQIQKTTQGNNNDKASQFPKLSKILDELYLTSIELVSAFKLEKKDTLLVLIRDLKRIEKSFRSYSIRSEGGFASPGYIEFRKKITDNIAGIIENTDAYLNDIPVPVEYELYGNTYFYYNTRIVNKINRYGNGLVPAINKLQEILGISAVQKLETPHYLTIIYPTKVEKVVPVIRSSLQEIDEAPVTLENRTVVMSDKKHQILVDDINPTLEIFDHLKQDGDIISLNFNGDWIFQNLSLERKPKKFILKLNEKGKNFLILHAINEGSVPPNTIGINYTHKGRKKRYIMQSNLRTSQMVEIKLDQ
jgi:hypothetical protein